MDKKQAMKVLKHFHDKSAQLLIRTALDTVIPELKESEDERIRKTLIAFINECWTREDLPPFLMKEDKDNFLAWLEKQGEQKETLCDKCKKAQPSHSCQDITELGRCAVEHEQKPADKVKPKYEDFEIIPNKPQCHDKKKTQSNQRRN